MRYLYPHNALLLVKFFEGVWPVRLADKSLDNIESFRENCQKIIQILKYFRETRNVHRLVCPDFCFLRIRKQAYEERWVFCDMHTRYMSLPNASKSHGEGDNDILSPKMTLKTFSVVVCKARIRSQEPHICILDFNLSPCSECFMLSPG